MRRRLVGVLLVVFVVALSSPAIAGPGELRCRFQRLDEASWSPRETRRTVACFAERFGVDVARSLYVVDRESHFHARAVNHGGCGGASCRGAWQHHWSYWPGRLAAASDALERFDVKKRHWWNPRVNTVVAMVMIRRGGWSPWGL